MEISPLVSKVIVGCLTFLLSVVFGYLPVLLARKCGLTTDNSPKDKTNKKSRNVILAFLVNFGGGVLFANAFCHWFPEMKEKWEDFKIESKLPLPEVITLCGFFIISIIEEVLHHFLSPHEESTETSESLSSLEQNDMEGGQLSTWKKSNISDKRMNEVPRFSRKRNSDSISPPPSYKSRNDSSSSQGSTVSTEVTSDDSPEQQKPDLDCNEIYQESLIPGTQMASLKSTEDNEIETDNQGKSSIRVFFVVSALSFHSVIEGMTMGLEKGKTGIWMSFLAVSLHKFVIAFAIGIELLASKTTKANFMISIGVFSIAPIIGITIGILLTEVFDQASINQVIVESIQAFATGTILYVVFFEVFPKGRQIGGTGFQHAIAMTVGILVFLPTLLLHEGHKCGGEETSREIEIETNNKMPYLIKISLDTSSAPN